MGERRNRIFLPDPLAQKARAFASDAGRDLTGQIQFCLYAGMEAYQSLNFTRPAGVFESTRRQNQTDCNISPDLFRRLNQAADKEGYSRQDFARQLCSIACEVLEHIPPEQRRVISEKGLALFICKHFENQEAQIQRLLAIGNLLSN